MTDMLVPAPTTPPAKADGRQCCPLVIDPCLLQSFRVNELRHVKANPAQGGYARYAQKLAQKLVKL
jgi:hypothetical protein